MPWISREAVLRHAHGFRPRTASELELTVGGAYRHRVDGEYHLLNPQTISKLQHSVQTGSLAETFKEYSDLIDTQNKQLCTLRGLLQLGTRQADSA